MKNILIIYCLINLMSISLSAQQFAGEEQRACGGTGAVIGISSPNPSHCYLWEVAEGMDPGQINSTNPLVKPNMTTTYRVTVTDQNFSFKSIDQVKVKVDFGGIVFQPTYINPNGEANQCQAILTANEAGLLGGPVDYTWSIEDMDTTGCSIDPSSGWISNCNMSGKIKVIATNDENTSCKAEKTIEVNQGVKDLIVRDVSKPGRVAHAGDTLYMTTTGPVEFEAVPNEGTTFPAGQPNWSGDLTATNEFVWSTSLGLPGTYEVIAGEDKKVYVNYEIPVPIAAGINLDLKILKDLKEKFKKIGPPLASPFCNPIPVGVTLPGAITASFSSELVPKFNDRRTDKKLNFQISAPGIGMTGCAPLLPCCGFITAVPGGNVVVFAYFRAAGGISFAIDIGKDPSTANGDNWVGSPSMTGSIEIAVGASADASLGPFGIAGAAEAFTKAECKARIINNEIQYNASWNGLQYQANGSLYVGGPSNPTILGGITLGPFNIVEGKTLEWTKLADLNSPNP